jgi:hypothetical protein
MKMDGSNDWEVRAMDTTKEGGIVIITGKGTGQQQKENTGSFSGEVTYMTASRKLSWLNSTKGWVEGTMDLKNGEATIKVYEEKQKPSETVAVPMM